MQIKRNYARYIMLSLVLMLCLTFIPNLNAHAEGTAVDLIGDSSPASSGTVRYGVTSRQTGYLCYLLTADGNAVAGTRAYAFSCPSFHTITAGGTPWFNATSRRGGYSANRWSGVAPWGCSPFNADATTNSEVIRNWMQTPVGDLSQAWSFIKTCWGIECAEKYATGDYILVIETIMHFRYSFNYIYKDLSLDEWRELFREMYPSMPDEAIESPALAYYQRSQMGTMYRAPFGRPVIGTVRDCLNYKSVAYAQATSNPYIEVRTTNLFSRYLNQVAPFAERIGAGSAGERAGFRPWTGGVDTRLSDSQVNQYGVAMLVISALDDDIRVEGESEDTPTPPPSPDTYDGTLYTLTSAGGSSSSGGGIGSFSGGGSGDTTYLGSGYGADRCAIGDLYAENCATGDEPYALADRLKSGMSYEGSVPPVVFSGTSYDLAVDNSMAILPSMLTVDPSTFPHVSISSSPESSYTSYLSTIRGSLSPSISLNYRGSSVDTYSGGSLESTPVIGGVADTKTYRIKRVCTLTQANCSSSGSAISWEVSGDYNNLSLKFAQVFYNHAYCAASSGSSLLENTDLMQAFWVSSDTYVAGLKADGTLERYWNDQFENYCRNKGNQAGNSARSAWEAENPAPEVPDEPVRSDYATLRSYEDAMEDFEDAESEYAEWVADGNAEWQSAYDATYNHHRVADASSFICRYETPNAWVFKYYYCSPIMQRLYGVHDKLPIDDGPARGRELWDEAWKVSFSLTVQNTAPLGSDVLDRMITYMPLAGSICTDVGSTPSVGYYVSNAHITNTDFLLPDATSMDMR